MNIESRTDCANRLRIHVIRGEINLPEIKSFLGTLYESAGFDPAIHALWDVREAGFPHVTPVEIRELADFVRVHWAEKHRRKTALVVSGDFQFGLSRMFEQFIGRSAHNKIKTFRDLRGAIDWISDRVTAAPVSPHE